MEIDHTERAHSLFSPSSAGRWLLCPGSAQRHYLLPDDTSPYAEEGTRAHEVAETILRGDPVPSDTDPDMLEHVMVYVDWCRDAADGADVVMTERRVDFSVYTPLPNQTGTLDNCVIIGSPVGGVAALTDLKFGTGVRVLAKNNYQMLVYALAVYEEWDWLFELKRFDLRICQPRLGVKDVWEVSVADLLAFGEYVKAQTALALQPDAPLVAGEAQCRWCRLKDTCPAHLDLLHQLTDDVFDVVEPLTPERALSLPPDPPSLPPVEAMSVEQLARILPYRSTITGWLDAIHKRLLAEALAGREVPGWRLVEGRSRRKWADEDKTKDVLVENIGRLAGTWALVSPSEAETRLKSQGMKSKDAKALVATLTVKPPGAPTLVPATDERPTLDHDDGDVFEEVE
jgi:hypothetical protein